MGDFFKVLRGTTKTTFIVIFSCQFVTINVFSIMSTRLLVIKQFPFYTGIYLNKITLCDIYKSIYGQKWNLSEVSQIKKESYIQ